MTARQGRSPACPCLPRSWSAVCATRFPDAEIRIEDLAGDGDHYRARIVSSAFEGLSRVRQHQLVYAALKGQVGGELHALALETAAAELMRYRSLNQTGATASAVSLILPDVNMREAERIKMIHAALESGINTFEIQSQNPEIGAGPGQGPGRPRTGG